MHLIGIMHEIKNQTTENKAFPFPIWFGGDVAISLVNKSGIHLLG